MSARKQTARSKSKPLRYLVVVERTRAGFSARAPDLPKVVARGKTRDAVLRAMAEGIAQHLETLRGKQRPLPKPTADALYLEVVTG